MVLVIEIFHFILNLCINFWAKEKKNHYHSVPIRLGSIPELLSLVAASCSRPLMLQLSNKTADLGMRRLTCQHTMLVLVGSENCVFFSILIVTNSWHFYTY